jgi:hypothetical protein
MVWTGYMDDSHLVQGEHNEYDGDDIDDYYDPNPEPMTFQEWTDWYSRDLLNMWMSLRTYVRDASVSSYVMSEASYSDFVEFLYTHSSGFPNGCPS